MPMTSKKSQLAIIFFTVFLYLVGFGVVIPIIPILSRDFGATALQTGLLMSVYSAMQFLFSPFWGRLSDRLGRRPILLFCLLCEGLSYFLFALARSLEWLFVARLLAGFFGASISTASAYISDITPKYERSKGMALIGVAFGLGFVVGPALGGGLAVWGHSINPAPHFDTSFAFMCVAILCFANFLFGIKYLTESLTEKGESSEKRKRLSVMMSYLKQKTVGPLMTVFLLSSLAMSGMEATLILFMGEKYQWDIKHVSFGFAYIGVIMVLTQGFIVRRLLPIWGERKVLRLGLLLLGLGLTGIALAQSIPAMAVTMTLLSIGTGLSNPSILGSISLLTDAKEQGAALGVTQSMASLGRILGPAIGGFLYGSVAMTAPFWVSGSLAFTGLAIVLVIYKLIPDHAKSEKTQTHSEKTRAALEQFEENLIDIAQIGFFQLDNLIRGRVPFVLLNLGADLSGWYNSVEAMHLNNCTLACTEENYIEQLQTKNLPMHFAVVVLDQDGSKSKRIANSLEAAGFMNAHYVRGGLKGLEKEKSEGF